MLYTWNPVYLDISGKPENFCLFARGKLIKSTKPHSTLIALGSLRGCFGFNLSTNYLAFFSSSLAAVGAAKVLDIFQPAAHYKFAWKNRREISVYRLGGAICVQGTAERTINIIPLRHAHILCCRYKLGHGSRRLLFLISGFRFSTDSFCGHCIITKTIT